MVPPCAKPLENPAGARPCWLLAPTGTSDNYQHPCRLMSELRLYTVCEGAAYPNVGECWNWLRRPALFGQPWRVLRDTAL